MISLGLVHGPRELIMNISKRWLAPNDDPSRGVDGFRLDAAENVPHAFWADWHKLCKSVKPDASARRRNLEHRAGMAVGRSVRLHDGLSLRHRHGISFLSISRRPVTPTQFSRQLGTLTMAYPFQVMLAEQNLLDSHDTDRWASQVRQSGSGLQSEIESAGQSGLQ